VEELRPLSPGDIADICASFEAAVADTMRDRLGRALRYFRQEFPDVRQPVLVVAGGVAANQTLKETFEAVATRLGFTLLVPPAHLCTDNAAMVAWAGAERLALGLTDPLDAPARARWPLDPDAKRMTGAGVKA